MTGDRRPQTGDRVDPSVAILAGPASRALGGEVCEELASRLRRTTRRRFPDGEARSSSASRCADAMCSSSRRRALPRMCTYRVAVAGRRVSPRRRRALTGVIPYLGYARQDRRSGRRSLGAARGCQCDRHGRASIGSLSSIHTRRPSKGSSRARSITSPPSRSSQRDAGARTTRSSSRLTSEPVKRRPRVCRASSNAPRSIVHKTR